MPYSQAEELRQRAVESERWDRIRAIVAHHGLYIVQLSKRRYVIVRVGSVTGIRNHEGKYFAEGVGSVAFGPDTWQGCMGYLAGEMPELPADLRDPWHRDGEPSP